MGHCEYRMRKKHTRTGISHDRLDLFAHFGLIAMDLTERAEPLVLLKRTFRKPEQCVFSKFLAILTDLFPFCPVFSVTVFPDHPGNELPLFPPRFPLLFFTSHRVPPPGLPCTTAFLRFFEKAQTVSCGSAAVARDAPRRKFSGKECTPRGVSSTVIVDSSSFLRSGQSSRC